MSFHLSIPFSWLQILGYFDIRLFLCTCSNGTLLCGSNCRKSDCNIAIAVGSNHDSTEALRLKSSCTKSIRRFIHHSFWQSIMCRLYGTQLILTKGRRLCPLRYHQKFLVPPFPCSVFLITLQLDQMIEISNIACLGIGI